MSGESNVTSGAPGSPSHHRHHRTHWHRFWKVARWVNPIDTAIADKAEKDAKRRDAEDATYQAELKGGVNADPVIDGKEWWEDVPQSDPAVFLERDDWDGHDTYRKLLDRVYGPGIAPNEYRPHVFLVHPDAAPVVHALMQHPDFWKQVECELKGGKGCHDTMALSVWTDIRKGLTKAADKLDHAEDRALGIGG